ncbi:MAG: glycosyltransferase [Demequinaceae bacterium]|nr:glycosyltransferase [Demequinaceae bacterium]
MTPPAAHGEAAVVGEVAVSVIIAAFDAERTLGEQLAAMSRQRVPFHWELLLCDNGSTDGTMALARSWQDRLPQLNLVDASARRGAGAARNTGASVARAPLLAFCDADDVVADDWLLRMQRALQHATVVAGAGETALLNPPGQASVSWSVDTVITKPYWPEYPAAASSNLGVRAVAFAEVGGFDESLRTGEDIDLCWRIQLAGGTLSRQPEVVVHIRKRVGLLPVFRQAYGYAAGDRQLKHKFARLIECYRPAEEASPAVVQNLPSAADAAAPPSRRGMLERLARILRPAGMADAAWRIGGWFGTRVGGVDGAAPRVDLPAV